MKNIKLSEWAKQNSYTYIHAHRLFKQNLIPNSFKDEKGTIFVKVELDSFENSLACSFVSLMVEKFGYDNAKKLLLSCLEEKSSK